MAYSKVSEEVIEELQRIIGEKNVIIDPEMMLDYSHDEFSLADISEEPEVVVKPETPEEISEILRLANRQRIPVTPRGGATGLCGGCVPTYKGIVLSLERMNRIVEVDKANQMIVAEPGVMLMDFYIQVEEVYGPYLPSQYPVVGLILEQVI